ncbi:hypothetical protein [Paenibacillus sp. Soil522]|uniref:hypothetical protein n=1 Tax=Paenibacillus sp. Soil522 TaxID=1736388 RepID=UPI0006FE9F1A|nr:hypothetical protein [Paenibacillus sp. Soil522]KRE24905.1 hypothetical protein ASG81_28225 [Paenibacillus sp. Soil522]
MDYYTITSQRSYDLGLAKIKKITHDNRKVFSQVYTVKPGPVNIEQSYVVEQGYRIKSNRREIYLTPPMGCHPPESWETIVRVEIEKFS